MEQWSSTLGVNYIICKKINRRYDCQAFLMNTSIQLTVLRSFGPIYAHTQCINSGEHIKAFYIMLSPSLETLAHIDWRGVCGIVIMH